MLCTRVPALPIVSLVVRGCSLFARGVRWGRDVHVAPAAGRTAQVPREARRGARAGGGVAQPSDRDTAASMQKEAREQQAHQHVPRRRTVRRQAVGGALRALAELDANTHEAKCSTPSQGQRRQSHDWGGAQLMPPHQSTEAQPATKNACKRSPRSVTPLASCAITVVSLSASDRDEDALSEDARGDGCSSVAQGAMHARRPAGAARRKGFKGKLLPSNLASPPSLSPASLPPRVRVRPGRPQQGRKRESLTEEELGAFAALAAADEDDEDDEDDDGDIGGYEDESVVVCPFRLLGSCLKGQHTQRELLSNHTIHSHLMSLAGLVHELRTEQRITERECQQLHMKVESQRMTIERLERCALSQAAASGASPHPEVATPHEAGSAAPQKRAGGGAESRRAPGSALSPAEGRPVAVAPETGPSDASTSHVKGGSLVQRVRRRASVNALALVSSETQTANNAGGLLADKEERTRTAKRMAEEIGTPTELSRTALDAFSLNETSRASVSAATTHVGGGRQLSSPKRRENTVRGQKEIHEGAAGDASPITVVGSQQDEVSSNDEVVLTMACSVHPPVDPTRLPSPGEGRAGSSNSLVRKRQERQSGANGNGTTGWSIKKRLYSFRHPH
ncbi:uncharacterized protein Tco025E_02100 [Trypanosoma conorhini]|uniref:Uncharacterized protein n=1 Tax=Trypanosoma conorhini TaxID=83891 RepID=A0A422Q6N0_9TRYP|nr:uncharacterized protein Tco025E_02100 [Trypanosoma conorhini]RNF25604.1 hypothetical protein Tco025E_02100 [Trypanosoma conorhini]